MNQKRPIIPNPSKITLDEKKFIDNLEKVDTSVKKEKYKGRMISMSDSFYDKLNDYLKRHPTEGNRSSFIVRVVDAYIDSKS